MKRIQLSLFFECESMSARGESLKGVWDVEERKDQRMGLRVWCSLALSTIDVSFVRSPVYPSTFRGVSGWAVDEQRAGRGTGGMELEYVMQGFLIVIYYLARTHSM